MNRPRRRPFRRERRKTRATLSGGWWDRSSWSEAGAAATLKELAGVRKKAIEFANLDSTPAMIFRERWSVTVARLRREGYEVVESCLWVGWKVFLATKSDGDLPLYVLPWHGVVIVATARGLPMAWAEVRSWEMAGVLDRVFTREANPGHRPRVQLHSGVPVSEFGPRVGLGKHADETAEP